MKTRAFAFGLALASAIGLAGAPALQQPSPQSLLGKPAPKLTVGQWLNSGGKPLSLAALKGKVVVLDFWTYW